MERTNQNKYIDQVCEYLCTIDDPYVCYNFPYQCNCCKKVKRVSAVKPRHQQSFCLSSKHVDCTIYQQEKPKYLPIGISFVNSKNKKRFILKFSSIGLILLVMLVLVRSYAIDLDKDQTDSIQVAQNSDTPDATMSVIPSGTLQESESIQVPFTNPVLAQETQPPKNQAVITSTNSPGFSTPFGLHEKYVLHQIQRGESLRYIADLYGVPMDSLHGINSLLEGYPIWVDQIIIVQLGVTAGPYEKLNAIQILVDTPIEIVADQYFTTVEKLVALNDLGVSEFIPAGRWLIVPNY